MAELVAAALALVVALELVGALALVVALALVEVTVVEATLAVQVKLDWNRPPTLVCRPIRLPVQVYVDAQCLAR